MRATSAVRAWKSSRSTDARRRRRDRAARLGATVADARAAGRLADRRGRARGPVHLPDAVRWPSPQESFASTTFAASSATISRPRPRARIGGAYAALMARARRRRRGRRRPRQPAERRRAARRARRRPDRAPASTSSTSASCRRRSTTGRCTTSPVVGGIQITGSHNPPEYNGFKLSLRHRVDARRGHPASATR